MSIMGAPGDVSSGIHITPLIGANGQVEGLHIGPPAVGVMSFAEMRASAAAASRRAAMSAGHGLSAAGHFAANKASSAAERAEVAACKRVSEAGFEEVAEQRGYTKNS
jgi:hypothetical protein